MLSSENKKIEADAEVKIFKKILIVSSQVVLQPEVIKSMS